MLRLDKAFSGLIIWSVPCLSERNHSVCSTQLQPGPIKLLLTYFITNQKARSGAVCCSSSNTWFAMDEINTFSPASDLKIIWPRIPKRRISQAHMSVSRTQKNFGVSSIQIQQEHGQSLSWGHTRLKPGINH